MRLPGPAARIEIGQSGSPATNQPLGSEETHSITSQSQTATYTPPVYIIAMRHKESSATPCFRFALGKRGYSRITCCCCSLDLPGFWAQGTGRSDSEALSLHQNFLIASVLTVSCATALVGASASSGATVRRTTLATKDCWRRRVLHHDRRKRVGRRITRPPTRPIPS